MDISPLAVVTKAYDQFAHNQINALIEAVADDAEWTSVGPADLFPAFGTRHGKAGAAEYFELLNRHLTRSEAFEPRFIAAGDTVVVQGRTKGAIDGKPIDSDWVHVLTVKDGKITAYKEFIDSAQVVAQLAS